MVEHLEKFLEWGGVKKDVALLAGLAILAGGLYYLSRAKEDPEGRSIYLITAVIGAVIAAGAVSKILVFGLPFYVVCHMEQL